jgi:hypothetical protein
MSGDAVAFAGGILLLLRRDGCGTAVVRRIAFTLPGGPVLLAFRVSAVCCYVGETGCV